MTILLLTFQLMHIKATQCLQLNVLLSWTTHLLKYLVAKCRVYQHPDPEPPLSPRNRHLLVIRQWRALKAQFSSSIWTVQIVKIVSNLFPWRTFHGSIWMTSENIWLISIPIKNPISWHQDQLCSWHMLSGIMKPKLSKIFCLISRQCIGISNSVA